MMCCPRYARAGFGLGFARTTTLGVTSRFRVSNRGTLRSIETRTPER